MFHFLQTNIETEEDNAAAIWPGMQDARLLRTLMLGRVEGSQHPGRLHEGGLVWSGTGKTSRAQL